MSFLLFNRHCNSVLTVWSNSLSYVSENHFSLFLPSVTSSWGPTDPPACSCCARSPRSPSEPAFPPPSTPVCLFARLFSNTPDFCLFAPFISCWRSWDRHHCLRDHCHQGLHAHCPYMYKYSSWEAMVLFKTDTGFEQILTKLLGFFNSCYIYSAHIVLTLSCQVYHTLATEPAIIWRGSIDTHQSRHEARTISSEAGDGVKSYLKQI